MTLDLVSFFEGTLPETERLVVERELLTDPEVLVKFLDLKREREGAADIGAPSARVWSAIRAHVRPRRRLIASLALAATAALIAFLYLGMQPRHQSNSMLFDANPELSQNSGVL